MKVSFHLKGDNCRHQQSCNEPTLFFTQRQPSAAGATSFNGASKNKNQNVRGWRWGRREILVCLRVNPKSWNTSSKFLDRFFLPIYANKKSLVFRISWDYKRPGIGRLTHHFVLQFLSNSQNLNQKSKCNSSLFSHSASPLPWPPHHLVVRYWKRTNWAVN